MIPWNIYQLTPRDRVGSLLRLYNRRQQGPGGAALAVHTYTVPDEKYLLMSSFAAHALSGGIILVTSQTLTVSRATTEQLFEHTFYDFVSGGAGAPKVSNHLTGAPIMVVPPEAVITVTTAWSGVNAANDAISSINGILIPKGEIAPV